MVGSLMYLASHTWADTAYIVSALSRFLTNPSPQHLKAAQRVFSYPQGTIYLAVVLGGDMDNENMKLYGYNDSDFASRLHTRRSTSGCLFFVEELSHASQSDRP